MGKARIDHSGAHNGIRSRKGRRAMPYGDLEAEIAHYSLKIVAYTADANTARAAYDFMLGTPFSDDPGPEMSALRALSSAVQSANFALLDAFTMHMMLQREKTRRDTSRRKLRKIGDISRPLS